MFGTSTNETPVERFRRRATDLIETASAVPSERWDDASPCEGWTVRDVARHIVDVQGMFAGFVEHEVADVPSVDEDPAGAIRAALPQTLALLEDPAIAQQVRQTLMGESSFESTTDRFASIDLVVHRWDLGTGAGLAVELDERDVAASLADIEALPPHLREVMQTAGAFGPSLEAPVGADDQTKLLALLGRRSW